MPDALEKFKALSEASGGAHGWQPIATNPKDGVISE